jgi:class 3 adenylate cyclase
VGFAELGEAVPPEEQAQLASRFAELARELVVAPVQFVTTIGNAVMLVCHDPVSLLEAATSARVKMMSDSSNSGSSPVASPDPR